MLGRPKTMLGIAVGVGVGVLLIWQRYDRAHVDAYTLVAATKRHTTFPLVAHDGQRVDDVVATSPTDLVTYITATDVLMQEITEADMAATRAGIRTSYCADATGRTVRAAGVTAHWLVRDKAGVGVIEVVLAPGDCP